MNRLYLAAAAVLSIAACAGCPSPSPSPPGAPEGGAWADGAGAEAFAPPGPDGAAGGPCAALCEHLRALDCQEGWGWFGGVPDGGPSMCEPVCVHVQSTHLTDLKAGCLMAAGTKAAARACGSVTCP